MNSYLQYRIVVDQDCKFADEITPWYYKADGSNRIPINTADELDRHLRRSIDRICSKGKVGLMLSGGMDSAILAAYLPEGTPVYTLRCVADSGIDETEAARAYAKRFGLEHHVVDITWEDYEKYALPLMKQKGYPIHSIEVQIYVAACQAKADGVERLIFGETADIIYGGHSKLYERDWDKDSFVQRFSFVDTTKVLRTPMCVEDPVLPNVGEDGLVDVHAFLNDFEYDVSLGFYNNACRMAGMEIVTPYAETYLGHKLDLERVRQGESKYIIRELFRKLYPDWPMPNKTPLPRPMAEWLKNWTGPLSEELLGDHIPEMTGDQKWYIYALNEFLLYLHGERQ